MIDLNMRAKTIKLLEEDIGVNLHDLESSHDFLDRISRAHAIENKLINQTSKFKTSVLQKKPLKM